VPNYFDVDSASRDRRAPHNAVGELVTVSEAVVKVTVDGERT
jgi:2-isopropylmalate synthase